MALQNAIDLRSDTFTLPTPAMREAMVSCELGDDVFGEDPTVKRLEAKAAEVLGMEAALLVCSGTMGNLTAMLAHCGRGDEVICGEEAHLFYYEQGGMAALGGIQPRTLRNEPDGTLRLEEVEAAIRADDAHFPVTRVLALENTHNRKGGAVLPPDYMAAAAALAKARGLRLHVDGARLFNAAAALGVPAGELVRGADSVTVCLSKGLCAPAGSVLAGGGEFIRRAHRVRKVLGGGMRQSGVLAAAGLVALEEMTARLAEDHAHARLLGDGLASIPGLALASPVATNIVYFDLTTEAPLDAAALVSGLAARGVKLFATGPRRLRAVTHAYVSAAEISEALTHLRAVVQGA
jgi:threonine aldolase